MARKNLDGLIKHTLHLFEGDFDKLRRLYPAITPSEIVRTLVRNHINKHVEPIQHEKIDSNDLDL